MLADAIRAETWRLSKNTATVFWSVVFLPVMGLVMSVIGNVFLKSNAGAITVNVENDVPAISFSKLPRSSSPDFR